MSLAPIDNSRSDQQTSRDFELAPIITARQLSFSFREGNAQKQILFDLDFDIRPGEFVLLSGPSGSGKTTLLTLIGGLRTVQQGQLSVLGQQLFGANPRTLVSLRRRIGFIFQTHNLFDFLTVRHNVDLAFDLHRDIPATQVRDRTEAILNAVGLGDHIDQHPAKLSVGQRQRVAIARALVTRPELVLADEPTAALDSRAGRDVVDLLKQLTREQNCPILMITHDNRILDEADRILSMEDGRILNQTGLDI